jgi:hypothetical protein
MVLFFRGSSQEPGRKTLPSLAGLPSVILLQGWAQSLEILGQRQRKIVVYSLIALTVAAKK